MLHSRKRWHSKNLRIANILNVKGFDEALNDKSVNNRSSRPEMFCKKGVFRNFSGLRPATLLKTSLWHRCFPVNFAKFTVDASKTRGIIKSAMTKLFVSTNILTQINYRQI